MNNKILKTIAATIIGEITLILLTTVAQEVLYHGISYTHSTTNELVFGGLATALAAVIAGFIARLIGGKKNYWPAVFISIIIIVEMTYLITSGRTTDPVWFDILAGSSLIVGISIGYALGSLKLFQRK